jgi:FRG domain
MPETPAEEIFRQVFADLHFPFFSADAVAMASFLADPRAAEGCHLIMNFPSVRPDRRAAVLNSVRGLLSRIDPKERSIALLCGSPAVRNTAAAQVGIEALFSAGDRPYSIQSVGASAIRWDEISPWPATYRHFLGHFQLLVEGYALLLRQRQEELNAGLAVEGYADANLSIVDQSSRVMPTRFHYAAASLGAWAGGAKNVQFFGQYATSPQIRDPKINEVYAVRVGFGADDAQNLSESGIVVVPISLAMTLQQAQGDTLHFGGLPIDEFNAINLPDRAILGTGPRGPHILPGLIVDTNYRAPFWARRCGDQALLGANDVLRDHYTDFYKNTKHAGLIRCKHYCAPIIEVGSEAELRSLAGMIPRRSEDGVFFRGQGTLYTLMRNPKVQRLLFGANARPEPSLVTSAARKRFDYDSLHFALRFFLEAELFGGRGASATAAQDYNAWLEVSSRLTCDVDYAVMALAQHYGLASHGLDVTTDIDVALWFATNEWSPGSPASYRTMIVEDWSADPTKWPVIFACQQITHSTGMSLQGCRELEAFGLSALRPQRQKAGFFLGGQSDHQNRLAEAVVCAFRLKPGSWPTKSTFDDLFPPPGEDAAYAAMLRFADHCHFASLGATEVARYHK